MTEQLGWVPSAWTGAEVKCVIRYGVIDLLEVQDVEYSVDRKGRAGGAGLGHPRNRYHKFGVPSGEFKISKNYLNQSAQADLFAQMIAGITAIETQTFTSAAAADDVTLTKSVVGVLYVLETGDTLPLVEGVDYTVNYTDKEVHFLVAHAAGTAAYITDATASLAADPMDGTMVPFVFDVEWRNRIDDTVIKRLRQCSPYKHSIKSGSDEEAFVEDLEGEFLALVSTPAPEGE